LIVFVCVFHRLLEQKKSYSLKLLVWCLTKIQLASGGGGGGVKKKKISKKKKKKKTLKLKKKKKKK